MKVIETTSGGSYLSQEEEYDDDGYPWWNPVVILDCIQIQTIAINLNLDYAAVKEAVLAHEMGHEGYFGVGTKLPEYEEEVRAWNVAALTFVGDKEVFEAVREWALASYND